MSDVLEVNLGENGGVHRFRSAAELQGWIEEERSAWAWMSGAEGRDNFGLMNHVNHRLTWLRDQIASAVNGGQPLTNFTHFFNSVFVVDQGQMILHSEGDTGRRVLDIHAAEGVMAGRAAYALATKRGNFAQMPDPAQVRGALLLAAPSLIASDVLSRRLTQERRNLRDRAERLIQRLEDEAVQRWTQHQDDRRKGRLVAKRWAKRQFGLWRQGVDQMFKQATQAHAEFADLRETTTAEFEQLRQTYMEAMRLQAPAAYWRDKSLKHRLAEDAARKRLYLFFPLLGFGLTTLFAGVAALLLIFPPSTNAAPLYFIVSAGLGSLAGASFWVGRLLTKLYLSEHHLRVDAEEREIMTTTYLALTKDQAADEKDRQIILSALFRNTPDGIVKDEGMADGTLAALIARAVGPNR